MNNIKWFGLLFLCFFSLGVSAQQVVKGKVTDASKEPMPGVNILVKGTTQGTVTDFDGNYELNAPRGAVLEFSFVGFQTQTKNVGTGSPVIINVTLQEDAQQLDDVVVIGYGVARKKDVTGSVNLVTTKDFNKAPAVNADQLLQGKVAGVSMTSAGGAPGSGQTIRVRGNGSLSLSSNPLIVIDGVPMNDGGVGGSRSIFNSINPEDIESMTVLKDASSTAIYGSRAANGVIMITTKKGKAGQDMKISFNTNLSIQEVSDYVDVMNATDFRQIVALASLIQSQNYSSRLGSADTNWQKAIYQTAALNNNTLSISGGGAVPYRASVGYSYADGVLKTDNFKRTTAKISLTPSLLDNSLKVELNANGTFSKNRFADWGAIDSAVRYDPTQPIYDANSRFAGYSAWTTSSGARIELAPINPLALLYLTDDTSKVYNFTGNLKVDYTLPFFKDITATVNVGLDYSNGKGSKIVDEQMPASSTNFAGTTNDYNNKAINKLFDAYVNYNKDIKDHTIGVMAGHSYQSFEFDNDATLYSFYVNSNDDTKVQTIDKSKNVLMSFFGRANYSYKDKYLLTATLRADASSKLAKEHRWGYFPSMALAWNIKNENFLKESEKVNELKLRLGYGEVGNVNGLGDYLYLTNYTRSISQGALYQFGNQFYQMYRPSAVNTALKWEIGNTINAGIDFGFWQNRLTGSIDVYRKLTKDLIASSTVDPFTNFANRVDANVGDMENKGIELGLTFVPIRNDNFRWSINYNVAYNKNEITRMPDAQTVGGIGGATGNNVQRHEQGQEPYAFYVYQQVYDANGKPIENAFVDRNGDGVVNSNDRYFYKSPFAPVTMGFGMDFNYKNWDLNLTTRANIGNYVYNNMQSRLDVLNEVYQNNILANLKANYHDTAFFQHSTESWMSDYYVQNGSFFKLDNVTLGYTFPDSKYNIRVYGTMQNVFTITKYDGLDPEVFGGIDNNAYPRPKTYLVGLSVNF